MECGNMDLFDFIKKCPLGRIPDNVAIDLLIQIFSAISYLHGKSIIHCDIKPENFVVIFDKNNMPVLKLIDFQSVIIKNKSKIHNQNFKGTTYYKPPEGFGNSYINEKVDEWAVGIIMYIMLTGYEPFGDVSNLENSIKFQNIDFNKIKNPSLRILNQKLLNRDPLYRISAKEGIEMLNKIKKNIMLEKRGLKIHNNRININNQKICLYNYHM